MTLEGILVPRRWNAAGLVTGLVLNTPDEREFVIEDPGYLLGHLRKRVRVTGTVIANRVVQVATVSVLESLDVPGSSSAKGDKK